MKKKIYIMNLHVQTGWLTPILSFNYAFIQIPIFGIFE